MALATLTAWAQTDLKIGTTPGSISPSAVLEAASTTKGFLIPRMTTAQMNAISSPANGLSVYNTTDSCLYIYRNSLWMSTCSPTYSMAWGLLGNSGTTAGTNFIGTTDAQSLVFKTNNTEGMRLNTSGYLGIGTTTPSVQLDVVGKANIQTPSTFNLFINGGNTAATGTYNTIVGINAMTNLTTGGSNVGFGSGNQNGLTTGSNNTSIGGSALFGLTTGSSNTAIGNQALLVNSIGIHNVGVGTLSLQSNVSGNQNTALGSYALSSVTTGSNNIGLGWGAGDNLTTGSDNIIIGYQIKAPSTIGTGQLNIGNLLYGTSLGTGITRSTGNIGINTTTPQYKLDIDAQTGSAGNPLRLLGLQAGATSDSIISSNSGILRRLSIEQIVGSSAWALLGNAGTVDGTNFIGTTDNVPLSIRVNNQKAGRIDNTNANAFFGYQAGNVTSGFGTNNTFIGHQAGVSNTSGRENLFMGYQAGNTNTTSNANHFIGFQAGFSNTSGSENTAEGYQSGYGLTTGSYNAFFGKESGKATNTGFENVGLGYQALKANTSSNGNVAIGSYALLNSVTGGDNVAVGRNALKTSTGAAYNVTVGSGSMANGLVTGNYNTALGNGALTALTSGTYNIGIGASVLAANTTGTQNTVIGGEAGLSNTTGSNNILMGYQAGRNGTALANSTIIGYQSGMGTTGGNNTFLGFQTGTTNTTGSSNTLLGYNANVSAAGLTNASAIGANAVVGASNSLVLGSAVNVGINTTTPQYKLDINAQTGSAGNPLRLLGLNAGATSDSIISSNSGVLRRLSVNQVLTNAWNINGNSGTNGGTNFIGTTDAQNLVFKTNNVQAMRINTDGNLGIGSTSQPIDTRLNVMGGDITLGTNALTMTVFPDSSRKIQIRGDNGDNSDDIRMYSYYPAADVTHFRMNIGDQGSQYSDLFQVGSMNTFDKLWYPWTTTTAKGLGIGTVNPQYKLDIDAQTGGTGDPLRLLGLNAGATSDSIITSNSGILRRMSMNNLAWTLNGNSGTTAGTNFIGTTDNQGLAFKTNNVERMRLSTVGYLGIGTTNPVGRLHIVNDNNESGNDYLIEDYDNTASRTMGLEMRKSRGTVAAPANLQSGDNIGYFAFSPRYNGSFSYGQGSAIRAQYKGTGTDAATNLIFKTSSADRMIIDETGDVGIGTISPYANLHIYGAGTSGFVASGASSGFGAAELAFSHGGIAHPGATIQMIDYNAYSAGLAFNVHKGTNNGGTGVFADNWPLDVVQAMIIDNQGRVGISTTSPFYKLDIDANTGSNGNPIRLQGLQAGATSDSIISSNSGILRRLSVNQILGNAWNITGNAGTTAGTNFIGTTDNQGLVVKTNNSTALTVPVNPMGGLINFASNRSGAVYPSYAGYYNWTLPGNIDTSFSLIGGIGSNDLFAIYGKVPTSTIATDGELHIASGDDGVEPIIFEQYNQVGTTFTERMRVHSNGNIGIGANAPDYKLQVEEPGGYNGDIAVRLYNTNNAAYLPSLIFQTARGTKAAATTVTSGTILGAVRYGGYDGTAFSDVYAGEMRGNATESWSATAHGTSLNFGTIANGTTTLEDRMIIDQNGHVGIGTNTPNQQLEITAAMRMPATTTSTTGVIYKGANRFIHDYKPSANDGNNTFMGINAGNFTMSSGTSWLASSNTGVGTNVLTALTEGGYNTAIGTNAMTANTTGSYNIGIGSYALAANTTGQGNTAVGHNTLTFATANNNTAVGNATLYNNTTGSANTGVGDSNLNKNTTGNLNTAVGQSTMRENTTGANNSALGVSALQINTTGSNNTSVGVSSLLANVTGNNNTAVGYDALVSTTSSNNVALGYLAGVTNTTGTSNTFVGYNTGATNTTGSNNTLLGYQANVSSAALTNATAIGNGATVNANNKIRLGNTSITNVETYGSFTTISDRRLKNNISDNNIGLNFIKAIRPVNYELKSQKGIIYDGFVAQEIDSILSKQGIKTFSGLSKPENTEGGYYTVSYATFVVPLVNAVKELDANNEKLKAKNEKLENELERLKAENAALKASTDKNSKDIESIKAQLGIKN